MESALRSAREHGLNVEHLQEQIEVALREFCALIPDGYTLRDGVLYRLSEDVPEQMVFRGNQGSTLVQGIPVLPSALEAATD